MRRIILTALSVVLSTLWVSCAAVVHDPRHVVDGFARGEVNEARVQCLYQPEWQFNRSKKDEPPAFGVALSGGGMRSASYAMGVLKALHERGELKDVDVISAVSGGAYTAGWYFAQKTAVSPAPADERLFCDDGDPQHCPYQLHLEQHTKIISTLPLIALGTADVAAIPLNLFANLIFGWHLNTTPHRSGYEHRLAREFFIDPVNKRWIDTKMPDITPDKGVPYLIINTTATIDDDVNHHAAQAQNSVFEYTPQRYGSDAFGYVTATAETPTIHHLVSISGAALDLQTLTAGAAQKTLLSALNVDLGSYKNNYNLVESRPEGRTLTGETEPCAKPHAIDSRAPFHKTRLLHYFLPFPLYFLHHYQKDSSGLRIYLTDGGHSDNTGAFSLIRRMTRTVLIVDASQDPEMKFDDYYTLKRAVESSLHAHLSVPAIDRILEGRGTFDARHPVMIGSVKGLYYGQTEREVKLVYVKLSIDTTNDLARYADRPEIKSYYLKHLRDKHLGHFPFQSTANQSYTPARYRAYRDLGYLTIKTDPQKEHPIWEWQGDPDDSKDQPSTSVTREVCGATPLQPTGVHVRQGDRLFIQVKGSRAACADGSGRESGEPALHDCDGSQCARWKDGPLVVDANGWERWYVRPFWFLKRLRSAHWYQLSGSVIGLNGKEVQSFPIGTDASIIVQDDGELQLFANDASCRYKNNYGALVVEIRRFEP